MIKKKPVPKARPRPPLFTLSAAATLVLAIAVMIVSYGRDFEKNVAFADTVPVEREEAVMPAAPASSAVTPQARESNEYRVQAVLSAKRRAVLASALDARITKLNFENGDIFKKGDVLIEYDCTVDRARVKEAESRRRLTEVQLAAYEKLRELKSISEVEYVVAKENHEQNTALTDQIKGRIRYCQVIAPFDGRVTNKMASQHEFVQTGRVLLDISSREPLRAEFLIPSKWLRWVNVGTPLSIYIGESDSQYSAKIVAIHGEVDPVSQSVQVVAEMGDYHEELLPGMSGHATFDRLAAKQQSDRGFLGLVLNENQTDSHGLSKAE